MRACSVAGSSPLRSTTSQSSATASRTTCSGVFIPGCRVRRAQNLVSVGKERERVTETVDIDRTLELDDQLSRVRRAVRSHRPNELLLRGEPVADCFLVLHVRAFRRRRSVRGPGDRRAVLPGACTARDEREDRGLGRDYDLAHQLLEVGREHVDRRRIEEILVVLEVAAELAPLDLELQGEVEAREPNVDVDRAYRTHTRKLQELRLLGVGAEVDLEERVEARVAPHAQALDELLERQFLVGQGTRGAGANAREKIPKGRIAGQAVPQDERVGEEADQSLELTLVAPCEGRAHQNVLLSGEAIEECVEGGKQEDEDRDALAPG